MSAFLMQVTALTINITISVSRIFKVLTSFKITCTIFFYLFVAVLAYTIGKCKGVYFDKVAGEQMIYNRE